MHITLADERHYACATVIIESENNTILFKSKTPNW